MLSNLQVLKEMFSSVSEVLMTALKDHDINEAIDSLLLIGSGTPLSVARGTDNKTMV